MDTRAHFHALEIGATFHTGKDEGGKQMVFKKTDKRKAICIQQIGYGNTRWIGGIKDLAPFATVYKWEEQTW